MAAGSGSPTGEMMLHIRVVEGSGLMRGDFVGSRDPGGTSDPYLTLQLSDVAKTSDKKQRSTKSKKRTVHPLWDDVFSIKVASSDFEKGSLDVNVWDWDRFSPGDKLGTLKLPLANIMKTCSSKDNNLWAQWHSLKDPSGKYPVAGQVYIVMKMEPDLSKKMTAKNKHDICPMPLADAEATKLRDTSVMCVTMNCGNVAPPENMELLLKPGLLKDLVVVGLQEAKDKEKTPKNSPDKKSPNKKKGDQAQWEEAMLASLNKWEANKYQVLCAHNLMEMRIFVFVKTDMVSKVSNICHGQEATGIAGVIGNKGGLAISFDFGGTSLCFISSHLAAHQDKKKRRNEDYSEICTGINIGMSKQELLGQFHHVFWMGDLNYRIDFGNQEEKSPTKEVFDTMKKMIDDRKFDELFCLDQLKFTMDHNEAFLNFQEAKVEFRPTFKVEKGKDMEYKSQRSPAWCDRVVWRSAHGFTQDVECTEYNSVEEIISSDHKPVYASFVVKTWGKKPGVSDSTAPVLLEFQDVEGENLIASDVISNESDPYIHFPRQPLIAEYQQSKKINKNLNPSWKAKQLPTLTLLRNSPEFLDKALLYFQVRDYDMFSADDKIGYGCISLRDALKSPNENSKFEVEMSLKGLPAGTIRGTFKLTGLSNKV